MRRRHERRGEQLVPAPRRLARIHAASGRNSANSSGSACGQQRRAAAAPGRSPSCAESVDAPCAEREACVHEREERRGAHERDRQRRRPGRARRADSRGSARPRGQHAAGDEARDARQRVQREHERVAEARNADVSSVGCAFTPVTASGVGSGVDAAASTQTASSSAAATARLPSQPAAQDAATGAAFQRAQRRAGGGARPGRARDRSGLHASVDRQGARVSALDARASRRAPPRRPQRSGGHEPRPPRARSAHDIFERPSARSRKRIGTSTHAEAARCSAR